MLCCATLALAAGLVPAVGRRLAGAILVAAGVLLDPGPLLAHAVMICSGG
jgi:hypothetical protein